MKVLLPLFALFACGLVSADEMPVEDSLSRLGYKNCIRDLYFQDGQGCGAKVYANFTCDSRDADARPQSRVKLLAIGRVDSDVSSECSPTIVYEQFLESWTPDSSR